MHRILTSAQMREMERAFYDSGVPSLLLMEQAAAGLVQGIGMLLGSCRDKRVLFVCGRGNNGGDGLAAARMLLKAGGKPEILLAGSPVTADAQANLQYANALDIAVHACCEEALQDLSQTRWDAVVDALFGTGFSRKPEGDARQIIGFINGLDAPVVAADLPSGLNGDTGDCPGVAVRADLTVTFHAPKAGMLLKETRALAGNILVADIGIPEAVAASYVDSQPEPIPTMMTPDCLRAALPPRAVTAHKGLCGRVLLYAGSPGFAGAAALAAKACLMAGAGLVTVVTDEAIIPIIQTLVPNATCVPANEVLSLSLPRHDVLAAGCGLGQSSRAYEILTALYNPEVPSVLDADAINLMAKHGAMKVGRGTVITPHPGEAARLLACPVQDILADPVAAAGALQTAHGCVVLLKNHASVLHSGDRIAINGYAAPALAKGGSGDALTGMIAALMAQRLCQGDLFIAAQVASLWMSLAARTAAKRLGERSVLTGDVLDSLGEALNTPDDILL